jgi:hypothetical protein
MRFFLKSEYHTKYMEWVGGGGNQNYQDERRAKDRGSVPGSTVPKEETPMEWVRQSMSAHRVACVELRYLRHSHGHVLPYI